MLAPIDKLNRTGGNRVIQIVVTTSCNLFNCSNCTQLLPFRKDYLHMSPECFRLACKSLRDWPGVVAMFGGNPCSHPQFPELCQIIKEEIPDQQHRGLWSNDLLGHGQIVHDTFFPHGMFNLNVHTVAKAANTINEFLPGRLIESSLRERAWHSTILAHWKDFGLSRYDWILKREKCDINQHWSAAIVERGGLPYAYFCEVAAALDGIKGLNEGLPVFDGWWKFPMASFQNQVRECCDAGCGIPLKLKGNQDLSNTYDVSPEMMHLTEDGWKGSAVVSTVNGANNNGNCSESTDYMRLRGGK